MAGPFDDLVGELTPGQVGWLPLDEEGNPTGPATIHPPPPPALACSVMCNPNSPLPEGQHLLITPTGADLDPPLVSNVERRPEDYVGVAPPAIVSLLPATAICGTDPDFEMHVN